MIGLQTIVSRNLTKLLDPSVLERPGIDLDADLSGHYGLTSLTMMLLITSICEEAEIDLTKITEDDVSRLRTPRDIIIMAQSAGGKAI